MKELGINGEESMIATHWSREIHRLTGFIDQINKARQGFQEMQERTLEPIETQPTSRPSLASMLATRLYAARQPIPKDYVYGYAGLFDFGHQHPDYSPAKTTASVYRDLASQILVLLSETTNLTFLDYAGLGYTWELPLRGYLPGLPTYPGASDKHSSTHITPRVALEHAQPTFLRSTKSLRCNRCVIGIVCGYRTDLD